MRSMSLLLGFSIVILVALFFGSIGKDNTTQKIKETKIEKNAAHDDKKSGNNVKEQSATE